LPSPAAISTHRFGRAPAELSSLPFLADSDVPGAPARQGSGCVRRLPRAPRGTMPASHSAAENDRRPEHPEQSAQSAAVTQKWAGQRERTKKVDRARPARRVPGAAEAAPGRGVADRGVYRVAEAHVQNGGEDEKSRTRSWRQGGGGTHTHRWWSPRVLARRPPRGSRPGEGFSDAHERVRAQVATLASRSGLVSIASTGDRSACQRSSRRPQSRDVGEPAQRRSKPRTVGPARQLPRQRSRCSEKRRERKREA